MDTTLLAGAVLALPGHALTPGAARSAAKAWLARRGIAPWGVDDLLAACTADQCWYTPDHGFVPADWPDAQPVTIVNLTLDLVPSGLA